MARIFSLGICLILLLSLFSRPEPVSAGESVWSAEIIPTRLNNVLGPVGIDIRDFAIGNDSLTIYAAAGNSTADNITYKSTDGGVSWAELTPTPIAADLIAVAPDDNNLIVIANTATASVFFSINGGTTWQSLGIIQETPGGAPAAAIYAIDISPLKNGIHYIAVAGKEAAGVANLWYFNYGATVQAWTETNTLNGFATDNETATLAFSPSFISDGTISVITSNASTDVKWQLFNIDLGLWNVAASYTGFPCVVVSTNITRLTSASIALAPTFQGIDPDNRKAFIGITVDGDATANATSGIYRFEDTTRTSLLLNVKVHSLAFNNAYLAAGLYDATTIYRSANPSSPIPTFNTSAATKSPGGENKVVVAWLGASIIAGTSGVESAMAKSTDNGATFDDISLIDTSILNARDAAVSSSGSVIYLVTDNGTNTSLWRKASNWKRVFSLKNAIDFIVRIEPSSASTIYLAKTNNSTIYYNSSAGAAAWLTRNCIINVQDMAVESNTVAYVLDGPTGSVTKTINSGTSWIAAVPTTLNSGATIVSVSTNILLVGSQDGFVAYSMSGSISWTKIPQAIGAGAGNVQVVADANFNTNRIIYAAGITPGQNIVTWTIGTSSAWKDIFNGTITGGIFGLAITNNVLYALEFNGVQSTLWRHISPATAAASSTEWNASTTTALTDVDDANVQLDAVPRALKASAGKLWAIKRNGTNKLYSYTDYIIDVELALIQPGAGTSVRVNSLTGLAYDMLFTWDRPTIATEYELFIAYDEGFLFPVATITVTTNNTLAFVLVGPTNVNFMPGETYYWKVRTTKPGFSPYSVTRYFTIESLPDASAQAMVAGQSGMITGTNPAFSWLPLQGATEYQFMLSDNPEMDSPILDANVSTTAIKVTVTLEHGKTYFWRVRAIKPIESNWSALVIFKVTEKPTETKPAVILEEGLPSTFTMPPATQQELLVLPPASPTVVTPGYFHIIMFAMAVILGVVVVMIFNPSPNRLFSFGRGTERSLGPYRKVKTPGTRPTRRREKPETDEEESGLYEAPEDVEARLPPIEKSKESAAVIFAAKSFIWMLTEEKETDEGKTGLSEKEELSLGKKVADRIRALTKSENLYIKHPEDAAMLLRIWVQYGSRDETSRYLAKSFTARPENAIRLLKCYLPPDKEEPSADDFTRAHYDYIAEVVDPDKVYAALTKVFKFKVDAIEEKAPVKPAERNLAFKFMRLHLQTKGGN